MASQDGEILAVFVLGTFTQYTLLPLTPRALTHRRSRGASTTSTPKYHHPRILQHQAVIEEKATSTITETSLSSFNSDQSKQTNGLTLCYQAGALLASRMPSLQQSDVLLHTTFAALTRKCSTPEAASSKSEFGYLHTSRGSIRLKQHKAAASHSTAISMRL